MYILTKKEMIEAVAERWKHQYFMRGVWGKCKGGSESIYNQLKLLGSGATEDEIAAIIGNRSWTENKCDDCGNDADITAVLAENSESSVQICLDCLHLAIELCNKR